MEQAGHEFLASLGKSRLRPGGKKGTEFLLEHCKIQSASHVLEVACNRGYNLIDLAKRFNCHVVGLDQSASVVKIAENNIEQAKLSKQCKVVVGDACHLPFKDASFDVIINEAMLTMLPNSKKRQALQEYRRVLKNDGYLLTHDLALQANEPNLKRKLSLTIKHSAEPLTLATWQNLLNETGFVVKNYQTGAMSLMSPIGLIRDEGLLGAMKIVKNGLKAKNRQQFSEMFKFFFKQRKYLSYVAFVSVRKE